MYHIDLTGYGSQSLLCPNKQTAEALALVISNLTCGEIKVVHQKRLDVIHAATTPPEGVA